jgi:hypothetical protein
VNFAFSSPSSYIILRCLHEHVSPKVQNNSEPRLRCPTEQEFHRATKKMPRYVHNSRQQYSESNGTTYVKMTSFQMLS